MQLVTWSPSNAYFLLLSDFTDEQWPGPTDPSPMELDTLLKEGAPGNKKNFVSLFMGKVISNLSLLPCNM